MTNAQIDAAAIRLIDSVVDWFPGEALTEDNCRFSFTSAAIVCGITALAKELKKNNNDEKEEKDGGEERGIQQDRVE